MRSTIKFKLAASRQQGATLVITMIVLLVLTMLAVNSTSSNRVQSVMARNNQFQLEAWNKSYSELTARINAINNLPADTGIPDFINRLSETGNNDIFTNLTPLSDLNVAAAREVTAAIRLVKIDCLDEGSGFSTGVIGTNDLILSSLTNLRTGGTTTNQIGISSNQRQRLSVNFTYGQKGVCTAEEEISNNVDIPVPGSVSS